MRFGDDRGSYEIVDLPGSPQVAVSIHSFVFPKLRGKGYGTQMHTERLEKLKKLGYDYVVCTVNLTNLKELAILKANDWRELSRFRSSASEHMVGLFGKSLTTFTYTVGPGDKIV